MKDNFCHSIDKRICGAVLEISSDLDKYVSLGFAPQPNLRTSRKSCFILVYRFFQPMKPVMTIAISVELSFAGSPDRGSIQSGCIPDLDTSILATSQGTRESFSGVRKY